MLKSLAAASIVLLLPLAACATTESGWTGTGAEPFDQAYADCQGRTSALGGREERQFAIDTCMANKGWTRPKR